MNDDFDYYLSRKHWLVAYPDYKKMLMPLVEAVATTIGIEIQHQCKYGNDQCRTAEIITQCNKYNSGTYLTAGKHTNGKGQSLTQLPVTIEEHRTKFAYIR